ncbi:MAG: hypothetical protein KC464_18460, partial [Myxococcales bacterium]|nr:hypothetical protein [Myxococcales bacterium]
MLLLLLLLPPVVVGVAAFFLGKRRITPLEVVVQIGVVGALIVGGYYATRWLGVQDTEIWNGRIASAGSGTSSCCHSYDCNCHEVCTGEGDQRSCSQHCDTCYEHSSDVYWEAYSSNGEQVYYDGCNPPGSPTPARYLDIRLGEPTAVEHRFTNYVKADPDALIHRDPALRRFRSRLPPYPRVSGWQVRRFLFVDLAPADMLELDDALDELNADLGAAKQVDVIVVVVAEEDPAYFDALAAAWLGGKKNDVVLVIGAPRFPAIAWARVMAWNKATGAEDELEGALARRVELLGAFDGAAVLAVLRDEITRGYQRRPFSELDYLMARARPSGTAVAVLLALGLALSALLQWRFWRNQRRMTGLAPHLRVTAAVRRLRAWWRG